MDVHVKLGDSRLNGSRDIRGADFVLERTNIIEVCHIRANCLTGVSLKNGKRKMGRIMCQRGVKIETHGRAIE